MSSPIRQDARSGTDLSVPRPRHNLSGPAALLLVLVVALTQESLDPFTRAIGLSVACVIVVAATVMMTWNGTRVPLSPLTLPLGLLVLFTLVLLPRSPLPGYAVDRLASLMLGYLVFVMAQISLLRGWRPEAWENALLAVGLLLSALAAAVVVVWYQQWANASGALLPLPPIGLRLPGILLGHPNIMAGFLNLLLPIVWVRLIVRRAWFVRLVYFLALCTFVGVEYFASSRGGWLGAAAGLGVTTVVLAWSPARRSVGQLWRRNRGVTVAAGFSVIAALAVAGLGIYALLSAQASQTVHAPASTARTGIWGPAVDIFLASPLVGQGPASFVIRFAQATHLPPGFSTNHAHNLILQLAAEGGVIAVSLALLAFGVGVWCLLPSLRRGMQEPDPALAAYLGGFTALLVHHSVDYLFNVAPYLVAVMVMAALLTFRPEGRVSISLPSRALGVACSLAAAVVLAASLPSLAGTSSYLGGLTAAQARDWPAAHQSVCHAADQAASVSIYHFECALAIARDAAAGNPKAVLEDAIREQKAGLALDPTWPVHRANLAGLEWAIGNQEEALAHMRQAAAQAPRHALLAANLGQMLEELGRDDEAIQAYRQALDADPLLRETAFFASSPLRARALAGFMPSSPPSESDRLVAAGRTALDRSDPQAALPLLTAAVEANPRSARALAWRAWAYADLGQPELAWGDVQTALFIDSRSPEALGVSALVAQRLGRDSEALEFARRLFNTLEESSLSTSYYAELYRRPFLPFDLVPQLRRLIPTREMHAALEMVSDDFLQQQRPDGDRAVDLLLGEGAGNSGN